MEFILGQIEFLEIATGTQWGKVNALKRVLFQIEPPKSNTETERGKVDSLELVL